MEATTPSPVAGPLQSLSGKVTRHTKSSIMRETIGTLGPPVPVLMVSTSRPPTEVAS